MLMRAQHCWTGVHVQQAYLLAHSANVTACASTGDVHTGDGTCVDPVPQCPTPTAPRSGTVRLSADFIIPGVTAEYACPGTLVGRLKF